MRSFITGSRIYGAPKDDSDIDLVVQVSYREMEMLEAMCDENKTPSPSSDHEQYGPQSRSLQFGRLNLIVTTDEATFSAWRLGNHVLRQKNRTIQRDEAVELFKSLFAMLPEQEASEASVKANELVVMTPNKDQ